MKEILTEITPTEPPPDVAVWCGVHGWYWSWLNFHGDRVGKPLGPFASAVDAGRDARAAIIAANERKPS